MIFSQGLGQKRKGQKDWVIQRWQGKGDWRWKKKVRSGQGIKLQFVNPWLHYDSNTLLIFPFP